MDCWKNKFFVISKLTRSDKQYLSNKKHTLCFPKYVHSILQNFPIKTLYFYYHNILWISNTVICFIFMHISDEAFFFFIDLTATLIKCNLNHFLIFWIRAVSDKFQILHIYFFCIVLIKCISLQLISYEHSWLKLQHSQIL